MNKLKEELTLADVTALTVDYLEQQKKMNVLNEKQYEELSCKFWDFHDSIRDTIEGNFK